MIGRKSISKRLRFEVFARDGFSCRYCGASSETAKLVVDHIHPVCQGGTNDPANLITACEPCNQGKGGKTIIQTVPTATDELRLIQEYREQEELAQLTKATAKARADVRQQVCNYYCDLTGEEEINRQQLSTLVNILEDVGPDDLMRWMDIAYRNTGRAGMNLVRYVCGIRKNSKEDEEIDRN